MLSEVTIFEKYAKYIPEIKRRETYPEITSRYLNMMGDKFPVLRDEIWEKGSYILNKDILPSMRAMQFAGIAIERNNARLFNCSYCPISDYRVFSEILFLLLGGSGCGYSVQKHHVRELPEIRKPVGEQK